MSDICIKLENIEKSYILYHKYVVGIKNFLFNFPEAIKQLKREKFTALKNLSFQINKNEVVGIIGRNGAGKSTLLGLIAGVIKPDKGSIYVNGKIAPLLELGAGFHPDLTGYENIILNGVLLGLTKKEILMKIDDIIEFSELGEFIFQPIRTYSSGMLARLGFSVAVNIDADILLVDEVLAVGDVEFQRKCYKKIESLKRKGVTIVFVSHDFDVVRKICSRVIWLDKGNIVKDEKPEVLFKTNLSPY